MRLEFHKIVQRERIDFFINALHRGEEIATSAEDILADQLDTSDRENYYALRGIGYGHGDSLHIIKVHNSDEYATVWENFEALARLAGSET